MKKSLILLAFIAMSVSSVPSQARAFDFGQIIDPFCLALCDDDQKVVNKTYTNSNNVNSIVDSTVVTNVDPTVAYNTPVYNYNYDDNYNNNSPLGATCYPIPTSGNVGDRITWRASVYGGNHDYNISWSGTNGLSGSGTSVSKKYNSDGTKNASIRVRSGGQTITRNCGSAEIYDYDNNHNYNNNYNYYNDNNYYYDYNYPLTVSCSASATFAPVETSVTWNAYVSGGSGRYSYTWNGTDYLRGSSRYNTAIYHSPGPKYASITVHSDGQTITRSCTNTVTVGVPTGTYGYQYPNYNVPVVKTPAPVVKTVVKEVIKEVEKPVEKEVVKEKSEEKDEMTLASLFSLKNVPWGWVVVLVILVLMSMVVYLAVSKNKL